MRRFIFRISSFAILLLAIAMIGLLPAQSDSSKIQKKKPVIDSSYRSRASFHKAMVYADEHQLRDRILSAGGAVIEDYGAFALLSAPDSALALLTADAATAVRDDFNVLLLRAGIFDTTQQEPRFLKAFDEPEPSDEQLYLVQAVGPVKEEWFDEIKKSADILGYVPNNAYLVRASKTGIDNIAGLKSRFVQFAGLYKPAYKIAPEITLDSGQTIAVTVQLARSSRAADDIYRIAQFSDEPLISGPSNVLAFTNIRLRVPSSRIDEIARMSDVVWIEPYTTPELLDERQGLISSGGFTGAQLSPPGYLNWLRSKGITSTPDFLVDVADTGIDKGDLDPAVIHRDFLNSIGLSRVVYARLVGRLVTEGPVNDTVGHGTLDAAIVGGYNTNTGFPNTDASGYSYGLGIHPFVRLGISKIFVPEFTSPDLAELVDMMYEDGARISSNSWGAYNTAYDTDSQTYDALVRDARDGESGNQEITVVFASGNKGQGTLSTPGVAKNVICVGASENIRAGLDGCAVDSDGADDALSIIDFSSGGFTDDGRIRPDLVAPGTHIQSAASQDPNYLGTGVCGPRFYPQTQSLYTWSSGTSHSTPAVAGAAAIVRQYFQQATGRAPSPAMIKAFLSSTATYMTGINAGGSLPAPSQGWGLLNLGRALDDAPKQLIDQTQVVSGPGQTITIRGRVADPTKPVRVALAWTDAPGTPIASPVVNNLDLEFEIGGQTFKGNNFSGGVSLQGGQSERLNNIESVWLPAGTEGDFIIRVIGINVSGDGVPGNSDQTDQDFALVVYNGRGDGSSVGGGGGGPVDPPPTVALRAPLGGEHLTAGNLVRILWEASDDKRITSQKIEFSSDAGVRYDTIAMLDGNARSFDWKIPAIPTVQARIRVTVLDGVNLPVSSSSPADFEIITGPPDTIPPVLQIVSPTTNSILGGGLTVPIKWRESDNIGVIRRVIEFSTNNGSSYEAIADITAPSSGQDQQFDWQVPAALDTTKGKVRIRIFDGADNTALAESQGKFEVWPLPIITSAEFDENVGKSGQLEVFGRNFRMEDCEVYANGKKLKKLVFNEHCQDSGICRKVSSNDSKINKRVKEGTTSILVVRIKTTGQTSPEYRYRRKKSSS
jgi:hypothetical protein